jgi:hypothetical protein
MEADMNGLTRRGLLQAGGMALAGAGVPRLARAAVPATGGCLLCREAQRLRRGGRLGMVADSDADPEIYTSSGDTETDHVLGLALRRLAETFRVSPGFAFFDDSRGHNAFATERSLLKGGERTVMMGKGLFIEQMREDHDMGTTVIAICAHEFGHIYQFAYGQHARLAELDRTVRPIELHADFLAGYYLALRHNAKAQLDLQAVGRVFYELGDTDFNDRGHHGTPEERSRAITGGYAFGKDRDADIDDASRAGVALVHRML